MPTDAVADGGVLSTLANGLRVLEGLAPGGKVSVRELSEVIALPRQTIYRILRTLVAQGWAERDDDDTYRLTTKVWSIAVRSFRLSDVKDALAGIIRKLSADHDETVHLAVYERGTVVYIDKADSWQPVRAYTEVGGVAPAYCVATGKILLAHQSRHEQEHVANGELIQFTPETITSPPDLLAELETTARRGYAVNRGEWRDGVGGVAIPVLTGPNGEAVAIGFSGPAHRVLQKVEPLVAALRGAIDGAGLRA